MTQALIYVIVSIYVLSITYTLVNVRTEKPGDVSRQTLPELQRPGTLLDEEPVR